MFNAFAILAISFVVMSVVVASIVPKDKKFNFYDNSFEK